MHLNDAIGRIEGMQWLACHHEQACAMAAQGYARVTNRPALVQVTTGPGATNAITGVFGAWVDSLPMIVVSGQVKRETLMRSFDLPGLRQLGDQEVDIIRLVEPITKYAACVTDPTTLTAHLDRAIIEATSGRPGPVWLDIPVDVQATSIIIDKPAPSSQPILADSNVTEGSIDEPMHEVYSRLSRAKRPVLYLGSGVRLSGSADLVSPLAEHLGVPVVTGFNAHDLITTGHRLYVGRPGTIGDRVGNFAVQNSDCVLVIGCRLNIRQISYNWEAFAKHAELIVIDIDPAELRKPTIRPSLAIEADAKKAMMALLKLPGLTDSRHAEWVNWLQVRRTQYPVVLPEYWLQDQPVNPYCFGQALSREAAEDEVVVTGDGMACVSTFQSFEVRGSQRLFSDSGSAPMGFDLPAAIGAHRATGRRVVCIAGDGSIMMNLQELQTIAGHSLPIKVFVFNNDGYLSIKLTQRGFFGGHLVGSDPSSGVTFPSFEKLAAGFGLPYMRVTRNGELSKVIRTVLDAPGPGLCEVILDSTSGFSPRVSSRRLEDGTMVTAPLEDMFPFLDRDELAKNMIATHEPPFP